MSRVVKSRPSGPRSVAVIGGSPRDRSAGRAVIRNLRAGGFAGQIGWVSPRYAEIDGMRTVKKLKDLPWSPDLVVITVPATLLPQVVSQAAELGVAPATLAIAWCLRNRHVSSVILGASAVAQLEQNLQALAVTDRLQAVDWQAVEALFPVRALTA